MTTFLRIAVLFVFILLNGSKLYSDNLDSLWRIHNNTKLHDTIRLLASEKLVSYYQTNYIIDTAIILSEKQLELAKSSKDSSWIAYAYYNVGYTRLMNDEFKKAIDNYLGALSIYKKKKSSGNIGNTLNNIAFAYYKMADYNTAKRYYFDAKSVYTERKDTFNIGRCYNQLALISDEEGNLMESLDYYFKALKTFESINSQHGISVTYINIATVYEDLKDKNLAKEYFEKAYKIKKDIGDDLGQALCLSNLTNYLLDEHKYDTAIICINNALQVYKKYKSTDNISIAYSGLGSIYQQMKKYDKAAENYELGITEAKNGGYIYGVARYLASYGGLFLEMKEFNKAIKYCSEGLEMSLKTGQLDGQKSNCKCLYSAYEQTGDFKKALEYHKKYISLNDSIIGEEKKKEATRKIMTFNFTKAKLKDSLEYVQKDQMNAMKIKEQEAQLDKDRIQKYALYGGMGFLFVLGLVSYKSYTNKKKDNLLISKQKDEVELQKHLVEEKNKEILDSITYAKRIQGAILPPSRIVKEYLPDSFILYIPKDIVAGDFYWMEHQDDIILFAAADCTGHGVPGAMVSVVCNNGLNRSVREYHLADPGMILDKTRALIIEEFEKSDEEVKDGMDISLCAMNLKTKELKWAGANNPIWIINNEKEITEIKPNKQPIGKYINPLPFTTRTVKLTAGDTIYIFTDGLQDQFGGESGKKFKTSQMKKLLSGIQELNMEEQKLAIQDAFNKWKGKLEQVDDVCVIGVRIS